MMQETAWKTISALLVYAAVGISPTISRAQDNGGYVGTKSCTMCHPTQKKVFFSHGHPNMLRPIVNGTLPEGVTVQPPEGYTAGTLSYIIGSFNVYARFIDSKGYVITGKNAQWSLEGKAHTAFMPDIAPGTMKYECIKCHVVGWKASGSYEKGVKNSLEGISGVWFENGVGCEACHGPGQDHIGVDKKREVKQAKGDLKIVVNKKAEACGTCHKRNDNDNIEIVADDLINSRQQYSELTRSKKAKFKIACVSCHEPHTSSSGAAGFVKKCEDCHTGKFKKDIKIPAMAGLSCIDCHMPFAAQGAFDTMVRDYHKGDTRSHIFGISTDPAYTLNDGTKHASLTSEGLARLTVEMTCYSCHKAGKSHDMDRAQLLDAAKRIH